jgi:hypothetical protein
MALTDLTIFGVIIAIVATPVIFLIYTVYRSEKRAGYIIKRRLETEERYVKGIAEIKFATCSAQMLVGSQFALVLDVTPENGDSYEISVRNPEDPSPRGRRWLVSPEHVGEFRKGNELPVRIHAKDPRWIFFEFEF